VSIQSAGRPHGVGGLPPEPGFYGWWAARGHIPAIPCVPHPEGDRICLLYVGIAPRDANSEGRLRSRVLNQHIRGNTGSSTLRYALASLLLEGLALKPYKKGKKCLLPPDDNERLSAWMNGSLSLTWCARAEPWIYEAGVIEAMEPPLNLAENVGHPLYSLMKAARAGFRDATDASV
jgi:hypothetical protein